jgi:hypothetical protein
MARNPDLPGYTSPGRYNLTVLTIQHRLRQGLTAKPRRARTPAEQVAAITPMSPQRRDQAYERQSPGGATPRQRRRDLHKMNKGLRNWPGAQAMA